MAECGSSQAQLLIERLVILVELLFFSVPADIQPKPFFTLFTINLSFSAYIMQLKVLFKLLEIPRVTRI